MINTKLLEKLNYIDIKGLVPKGDVVVSTDTRTIVENSLYVPLKGEKFDAHNFIEDAITKGAMIVLVESSSDFYKNTIFSKYSKICFIVVQDNLVALQELAALRREQWKSLGQKTIIGITGSNGKTTHKEMLKYLAGEIFPKKVHATLGNLNNHIGLPLTLLALSDEHEIAVVEEGTNHPGEIEFLTNILAPDLGILTNIGLAHIEFFKTQEAIFVEKTALYRFIKEHDGQLVACDDDPMLARLKGSASVILYGEHSGAHKVTKIEGGFSLDFDGETIEIHNENLREWYNLKNLAGCFLLLLKKFPEHKLRLIEACRSFALPKNNRSQWMTLDSGAHVFLDAYNANPSSMKVSLMSFIEKLNGKTDEAFFVLGDMNELGEFSEELHREIGQFLKSKSVKNVIFIGRFANFYLQGHPSAQCFSDTPSAKSFITSLLKNHKYFFIKGSRSLQLESLIDITK